LGHGQAQLPRRSPHLLVPVSAHVHACQRRPRRRTRMAGRRGGCAGAASAAGASAGPGVGTGSWGWDCGMSGVSTAMAVVSSALVVVMRRRRPVAAAAAVAGGACAAPAGAAAWPSAGAGPSAISSFASASSSSSSAGKSSSESRKADCTMTRSTPIPLERAHSPRNCMTPRDRGHTRRCFSLTTSDGRLLGVGRSTSPRPWRSVPRAACRSVSNTTAKPVLTSTSHASLYQGSLSATVPTHKQARTCTCLRKRTRVYLCACEEGGELCVCVCV
jgi:hypothetical protein